MPLPAPPLVVTRRPVDDALSAAWDVLADRVGAVPFARPGWLRPWAEAAQVALDALTAWRGPNLAGVLPIVWEGRRVRTPADWHTPWIEAVAEDDLTLDALAAALAGTGCPRVTLDFVIAGEPTSERCRAALEAAGYRLAPRPRQQSPYLSLKGTWSEYLAVLSTHRRSELRRRATRLEAAGVVVFEVVDGTDRLQPLVDEALTVEALGWKGEAGTAIAADHAVTTFYRQVAAWAAGRGWLRLAFLRLDGRAIAFDYCLETSSRHFVLKTGFDPALGALSPGLLLRCRMVERAFALGLESYELGGTAEPWKLEWAPATRTVEVVEAYSPTPAGLAAEISSRAARFAVVAARRHGRRR